MTQNLNPNRLALIDKLDRMGPAERQRWLLDSERYLVRKLVSEGCDAVYAKRRVAAWADSLVNDRAAQAGPNVVAFPWRVRQ